MLRATVLAAPLLALACAGSPVRGSGGDAKAAATAAELEGQLKAQSALIAEQQRRIEQLEVRLAALASKISEKAPSKQAKPAAKAEAAGSAAESPAPSSENISIEYDGSGRAAADPRKKLHTVKLDPRSLKGRRPRKNPVDRAPKLSTATDLVEPDEAALARLDEEREAPPSRRGRSDPGMDAAQADVSFAKAVQRLNSGDLPGAQMDLLAFARRHPQHAAADNAIHLAGLAAVQAGQCEPALPLFERTWAEYPAGDAVPAAKLEHARCLLKLGRGGEARNSLTALEKDHPDAPEASHARALLNGL